MDREIPIASRVISQKINKENRIKHLKKLSEIRKKTTQNSFFHVSQQLKPKINSSLQQNRNLEIQKNNIVLFNRIAEIIRKKPVGTPTGIDRTRSFINRKKKSKQTVSNLSLRSQNQFLQKRISQQKPTIDNKILFKERRQNLKYLSFIGRYPYQFFKRYNTQQQAPKSQRQSMGGISQLFNLKQENEGFQVSVQKNSINSYIFIVKDRNNKEYKCQLSAFQFKRELEKVNNDYRAMIGQLRLKQNGSMIYQFQEQYC